MSVPLDDLTTRYGRDTGIVKKPGDFARLGEDGAPYVVAPNGELNKDGTPKRLLYARPSSYGKQIENTTNLEKWTQRQLMLGVGTNPDLAVAAQALVGGDIEDEGWRRAADGIITGARRAAKTDLAAERGTHTHGLVEDSLLGRDPSLRKIAGELLDMPEPVQQSLIEVYHETMDRNGLTVLATELSVVNDEFRAAGKLDNAAQLSRPLRFRIWGGQIVTIDPDEVVTADTKTGKKRRDGANNDGPLMYWQAYTTQVYLYASSKIYNTETDERSPFPWPMSQQHAIIVHLDNLAALDGKPACELIYVDLATGRRGCEVVQAAKAFHRTKTMFSLSQVDDEAGQQIAAVTVTPSSFDERLADVFGPTMTVEAVAASVEMPVPSIEELAAAVLAGSNANNVAVASLAAVEDGTGTDFARAVVALTEFCNFIPGSPHIAGSLLNTCGGCEAGFNETAPPIPAETLLATPEPTPGAPDWACDKCNHGRHLCPGCGADVVHGAEVCAACDAETKMQAILDAFTARRTVIQARMDALKTHSVDAARQVLAQLQAYEIPTLKQSDQHTDEQLDRIDQLVMQAAANHGVAFGPPFDESSDPPAPKLSWLREGQTARVQAIGAADMRRLVGRYDINEAGPLEERDAAALADSYQQLPAAVRDRCGSWKREASFAGYSVMMNEDRTVRRFSITRAMVASAQFAENGGLLSTLREAVAVITGAQWPLDERVTYGAVMGALTVFEADRFTELSYELADDATSVPADVAARYRPAA